MAGDAARACGVHQGFEQPRLADAGLSARDDGAPAAGIAQGALLPTRIDGPFPLSGDPMSDAESLAGQANPGEVLLSEGLRRALGAHNLPFAGRSAELSLMNSLLERCV
ncbi:MAG: hypothetical protein M3O07_02655, partial [Pseudomonadota bacterium]|nr:hypothetical protein [Pseudomonadota bacterium]